MSLTGITGGPQTAQRLAGLGADAKKVAGPATRKGAVVLQKAIKAGAPVGPTPEGKVQKRNRKNGQVRLQEHRKIKNNTKVKKVKARSSEEFCYAVTFAGAFHAQYEELGSIHNAARPFIRPAAETAAPEAIDVIIKDLDKRLTRRGV